ncbi:aspartate-alanine antiporter [uncultured Duncaniella sp.]|uniref:aspartate-alanine antiporter n=1 Tax=uncultured Duncaniella sp. TaxID=2768039 RepID=UPI0025B12373|nr:aspartate-alanine antiporter [uncultured Duncaniella sp.]
MEIIESFGDILRNYPALAVFLTVGMGFLLGRLRIGSFTLGSVTAVLLVGVVVGQFGITVSGPLKTVFFLMFLFSIGYSVGPEFFKSLRGMGLRQVLFAVLMSMCCFAVTVGLAFLFGYTKGETVGLFAGSQTCSSLIGVGTEAISKLPVGQEIKDEQISIIPVCYAVTYIFGTLGTVIILGNFGPKLLGGVERVARQAHDLEKSLDNMSWDSDPAKFNAHRGVSFRSYRLTNRIFENGMSVAELESFFEVRGIHVYVGRVQRDDRIFTPGLSDMLHRGDSVVVCGPRKFMVKVGDYTGPEDDNRELLTYPVERVSVLVASPDIVGCPFSNLLSSPVMRGVSVRRVMRRGKEIALDPAETIERGDTMRLVGDSGAVAAAARMIGYADRMTNSSDLMFVGLAIFIGGLVGSLSVWIGNVPVSFGTSGGALVAGIVFGWLRSRRPTFGYIPASALWLMNNLGLNMFIAVVGIEAAPSFVSGLRDVGWMLFVAGAVGTTIPLLIGMWMGHKVFKFNPAITLGCCAGTRTCTASLGAVQDAIGSTVPAIGYTVTYAVSNILLVVWGMVTVLLV